MLNSPKLQESMDKLQAWLNEQVWFQEIRSKWEELDQEQKVYARLGASAAVVLLVLFMVFSFYFGVRGQRKELADKVELVTLIENARQEMQRLKDSTPASSAADTAGPLSAYIEGTAAASGIDKTSLDISPEKPGTGSDLAKESLVDVTVKHVNIRQVVSLAFKLESGGRPIKLRALSIDTKDDTSGALDATLSVSAFTLIATK